MKACAFIAALAACATSSLAFVAPLQSSALTFSSPRSSLAAAATAATAATAVSRHWEPKGMCRRKAAEAGSQAVVQDGGRCLEPIFVEMKIL